MVRASLATDETDFTDIWFAWPWRVRFNAGHAGLQRSGANPSRGSILASVSRLPIHPPCPHPAQGLIATCSLLRLRVVLRQSSPALLREWLLLHRSSPLLSFAGKTSGGLRAGSIRPRTPPFPPALPERKRAGCGLLDGWVPSRAEKPLRRRVRRPRHGCLGPCFGLRRETGADG